MFQYFIKKMLSEISTKMKKISQYYFLANVFPGNDIHSIEKYN